MVLVSHKNALLNMWYHTYGSHTQAENLEAPQSCCQRNKPSLTHHHV